MDIGTTDVRAAVIGITVQPPSIPCALCNCFSFLADTPKLEIKVNPTEVEEDNSVTMTCQVISSNPKLRTLAVSWFKDGRPLEDQERKQEQEQEQQMSKLTLHSVTKGMGGKYQCQASNDIGPGESEEVGLTVHCEFP